MTPAAYIRDVILNHCNAQGYAVFINHMPDKPDNAVCIYDVRGGRIEPRLMSGEVEEHPRVEIFVRGSANSGGDSAEMLLALWRIFRDIYLLPLGEGKILRQITKANTIASLGQEPQTRRWLYSQHFTMTLES